MALTIDLGDEFSGQVNPGLMADLVLRLADSKLVRKTDACIEVTLSGKPLTAGQNRNLSWAIAQYDGRFKADMEV